MNFLQRTPFFRLLIPLIGGIVVFQYGDFNVCFRLIVSFVGILLFVWYFLYRHARLVYQLRWLFGLAVFLIFFMMGYWVAAYHSLSLRFPFLNQRGVYLIELLETPIEKTNSFSCKIKVKGRCDSMYNQTCTEYAWMYIAKDRASHALGMGDLLLIRTVFQSPSKPLNPAGFDFEIYLARQGIAATAFVDSTSWHRIEYATKHSIRRWAEMTRMHLLDVFREIGLSPDELAVLSALTLGYKVDIGADLRENFTHAGAMHILAVSGLHVGIIFLVLQGFFSVIFIRPNWKKGGAVLSVCILWAYAFITGMSPSVIRSVVMFSFIAFGVVLERKPQLYNIIFLSAFIMLLIDPDYLFDVSFQLSYSAVLSIVYFQPKIAGFLHVHHPLIRWWWGLTAVSLAAQIGTLPWVLYYFQQFPVYFLLSNYLAIPVATLIIYVALFLLAFSWCSWCWVVAVWILKGLLYVLTHGVVVIHDLPYAVLTGCINEWQLFCFVAGIVSMVLFLEYKKYWMLCGVLLAFLIVGLLHMCIHIDTAQTHRLIVYADKKHTHVDCISRHHHQVITTDSITAVAVARNYWVSHKLTQPKFIGIDASRCFVFENTTILLLVDAWLHRKKSDSVLSVDLLIIGNHIRPVPEQLFALIHPRVCVVDQTIPPWVVSRLQQYCLHHNILFHSVRASGAYVAN